MKFRSAFGYDTDAASDESALVCLDKSLAMQSERDGADINLIVERALRTGVLPVHDLPPLEGDFLDAPDFRKANDLIIAANRAFMEQPAVVRKRFGDDPQEFVAFCSDAGNFDELVKLGLAEKKPVVVESPPIRVLVVPPEVVV